MINQSTYETLITTFRTYYNCEPAVVAYAPGRIEVLGNHTDYNEGYVFSAAINYGIFFAIAPSDESQNRIVAADLMHEVAFDTVDPRPVKRDTWANYIIGTVAGLNKIKQTGAFKGMFFGNVPRGSGLSSSAALEMCTAKAVASLFDITADAVTLAKIGQIAESKYAGCNCGLLDQISSLCGAYGKLIKTDFRTLQIETVDIDESVCFLMCNTVKHALIDGAYNSRREACEIATEYFATKLDHPVTALRDVSMAEWEQYKDGLDITIANRAAHPIGECERVLEGAQLLSQGDIVGFGQLLFDSHESSKSKFENSCKELDTVVEAARKTPGVLGARLSGGGFGGSVVVLVKVANIDIVSAALKAAYAQKYGKPCAISRIQPSEGASIVIKT